MRKIVVISAGRIDEYLSKIGNVLNYQDRRGRGDDGHMYYVETDLSPEVLKQRVPGIVEVNP
ncbi:MAG: hypothetical protein V1887_02260 [Candidatus Aenigmatarchaeota archaeon]